ncbi:MAG: hypothetical protein K8T20_15600 [Planctomycetes bacterium]|nr:hypothetical protein [Planctomycetota bacterium]
MPRTCRYALLAFLAAASLSRADGTVYRYDHEGRMSPTPQIEQRAAISFEGGRERLVITCQLDLGQDAQGVWIVPVPRDPAGCRLDIDDRFPRFSGRTVASEFRAETGAGFGVMEATQLLPIPVILAMAGTLSAAPGGDHVAVDSIVEKHGLHSEAVSADSVEALLAHVRANGVKAEAADFEPFRDYLNPSWTLVVTWIAASDEAREHFRGDLTPCMSAEFRTGRPFYPMKPTAAAYGKLKGDELGVRVLIWVKGMWGVGCSDAVREKLKVEYFHGGPDSAEGRSPGEGTYTRIVSTGHISAFTEDFFLTTDVPWATRLKQAWLRQAGALKIAEFVVFHLLYSLLVGLLTNLIVLGRGRGAWWIGLCNAVTILGVLLAVREMVPNPASVEVRDGKPSRVRPGPGRNFVIRMYILTYILLFSLPLLIPIYLF